MWNTFFWARMAINFARWKKNTNYESVISKTNGVSSFLAHNTPNWNETFFFILLLGIFVCTPSIYYKHLIMGTKDEIYDSLNGNIMPWICFAILQYTTQYVNNFLIFISLIFYNLMSAQFTYYVTTSDKSRDIEFTYIKMFLIIYSTMVDGFSL